MLYTEWSEDLAAALHAPFPSDWHKTKRQGGAEITFVEWHRYALRLNELVGPHGWEMHLRFLEVGGKLVSIAALTILGVTKENVGDEDEDKDNYGTACTNSFAQSMKRAAALFGMGLYMYDKAGRDAATKGPPRQKPPTKSAGQGGARQGDLQKPWERVMPFGKGKGKKLHELSDESLKAAIDWCQKTDASKFADLIQACADTIDHRQAGAA